MLRYCGDAELMLEGEEFRLFSRNERDKGLPVFEGCFDDIADQFVVTELHQAMGISTAGCCTCVTADGELGSHVPVRALRSLVHQFSGL